MDLRFNSLISVHGILFCSALKYSCYFLVWQEEKAFSSKVVFSSPVCVYASSLFLKYFPVCSHASVMAAIFTAAMKVLGATGMNYMSSKCMFCFVSELGCKHSGPLFFRHYHSEHLESVGMTVNITCRMTYYYSWHLFTSKSQFLLVVSALLSKPSSLKEN